MSARRRRLQKVYAQVPRVACKQLCQACCTGVAMLPAERRHLSGVLGGPPVPGFRERGFNGYQVCPLLKGGQCSVYADRPLICRLYAATDTMPCPHGCTPERPITEKHALRLMDDIGALT